VSTNKNHPTAPLRTERVAHYQMNNNKDDLRTVWICDECRLALLFHEDGKMHCLQTGHQHLTAYDIETGEILKRKEIDASRRQSSMFGNTAI
jgi:hypothetical protein